MIEVRRGDVVLVALPFVSPSGVERKRRPAVVVQSDRYNRRRSAVVMAAITSSQKQQDLPCQVIVAREGDEGRGAGLRTDSVVDCQTILTLPRDQLLARLGSSSPAVLTRIPA
jgi:mRNA-degrading endonuclease toxin of MazEF toxin-antitoxin module